MTEKKPYFEPQIHPFILEDEICTSAYNGLELVDYPEEEA